MAPERVTSLRSPFPRYCVCEYNTAPSMKCRSGRTSRWRHCVDLLEIWTSNLSFQTRTPYRSTNVNFFMVYIAAYFCPNRRYKRYLLLTNLPPSTICRAPGTLWRHKVTKHLFWLFAALLIRKNTLWKWGQGTTALLHLVSPSFIAQETTKGNLRSLSQAASCPPFYHARWRLHTVPFFC